VSAIIPISCGKPACLIGALRVGLSATIAARDGMWVFTGFEKPYPSQAEPIPDQRRQHHAFRPNRNRAAAMRP
jgi:hypothetical protein